MKTNLFFTERVEASALIDHCTRVLNARVMDPDRLDLRWRGAHGTVWARDVRATLAGRFTVPQKVVDCLGKSPQSCVAFEMGEDAAGGYLGFLVVIAVLGRWRGCVMTAGDLTVLSSKHLEDTSGVERQVKLLCEHGSHVE